MRSLLKSFAMCSKCTIYFEQIVIFRSPSIHGVSIKAVFYENTII